MEKFLSHEMFLSTKEQEKKRLRDGCQSGSNDFAKFI